MGLAAYITVGHGAAARTVGRTAR